MNCLDCQALVQQRLDGLPTLRTPEFDQHLAQCAACRELDAAARVLDHGVRLLPRPMPSDGLTARIVQAALADRDLRRRRVRLRLMMTAALAASILLLMFTGYLLPSRLLPTKHHKDAPVVVQDDQQRKPAPGPDVPEDKTPPALTVRADEARQAVARLTGRVADSTRDQAKTLLALAKPLELAPMLPDWEEPLDPAAQSLREATQSVAEGIEPMTRTARGAWNLFVKELPTFDVPSNN
jgi:hypothetical protein